MTCCEPGRPVKQAPRFPVGLLALVENFVTTDSYPACMRMCGWGARCVCQTIVACHRQTSLSKMGVSSPHWLSAGRQILNVLTQFQRDYLLAAPAGAYDSCLRSELRYALGLRHPNCWRFWQTARVPRCSQQKRRCFGRLTRRGHSSAA